MRAVTDVTGKKQISIIIFATKSSIITCDTFNTVEWIVAVAIRNDNVMALVTPALDTRTLDLGY